jgi:hypothetical protein
VRKKAQDLCAIWTAGKDLRKLGVPVVCVAETRDRAIGQIHLPCRFGWLDLPRNVQLFADNVVRAAGLKATSQRRAGVKQIFLMIERARATARIDVRLEQRHLMTGFCQQCGSCSTAYTRANDNNF